MNDQKTNNDNEQRQVETLVMRQCKVLFPKRNTRFKLSDFFQTKVDDFEDGRFLFLSAKKVRTKTTKNLLGKIQSYDEYGWIISTYCYNAKYYYKIFVCDYRQKAWKNHYHIESELAAINGCDGYAVKNSIEEFIDWMDFEAV
jgi:hypothetical protein